MLCRNPGPLLHSASDGGDGGDGRDVFGLRFHSLSADWAGFT